MRGGKREGAGRPKSENPAFVNINIKATPKLRDRWNAMRLKRKLSAHKLLEKLMQEGIKARLKKAKGKK